MNNLPPSKPSVMASNKALNMIPCIHLNLSPHPVSNHCLSLNFSLSFLSFMQLPEVSYLSSAVGVTVLYMQILYHMEHSVIYIEALAIAVIITLDIHCCS
jgi:hypothetical protein